MDIEARRHRVPYRSRMIDVWAAGDGPPIVVFHGWGLSGRAYRPVLEALAARGHRAIAPSLAVIEPPWSLQRLAELSAHLLASVEAAPATFVGHSFGGALAVRTAVDFPDLASSLVLVNSLGVSPGRRALVRIAAPGPHWRVGFRRETAAALLASVARDGGWGSLSGAARWVISGSLEADMETLRATGLPSAVLWAEGDSLLPRRIGERAAELLGGRFETVSAGDGWSGRRTPDHDWPLHQPEFFAERVNRVLAELKSPRRPRSRRPPIRAG